MKIIINTPIKAYLSNHNDDDIAFLKKELTYTDTSIQYLITKHKKNRFFRTRNPEAWQYRLTELLNQLHTCLLKHDGNGYYINTGIIPYLSLNNTVIENKIDYPEYRAIPWKVKPEFEPYPYQKEAVEELMSVRHGNISLPTGCGKSYILLLLARNCGLNTVVVTPSKSIFNELLREFQNKLGKKYVGGYGDGKKDIKKKITIAIGKSLTMLKEGSDAYEFFKNKQMLLVDESHTFAANQLEKVCHDVLSDIPYRFFVSATQTRGDGTEKKLFSIIGKNVLDMSLEDAISKKYLCPLKFNIVSVKAPSTTPIKDPLKCKRKYFLYNENIADLYAGIANASWTVKKESTLILVEELQQIKLLVDRLKVPYAYVHSGSKGDAEKWGLEKVDLQEQVDKFNKGEVKVLIGTRSISTGTNMYPTHNVCNWMGGASEIITKQGPMGRSTRKLEISKYKDFHIPKKFSRIWDARVEGNGVLDNHLIKRIRYYRETGEDISL